jgi:hypothetical protein
MRNGCFARRRNGGSVMRYRNSVGVDTKYVDTNHAGSTEPSERSHVSPMVLPQFDCLCIRVSIHRDDDGEAHSSLR